MSATPAQSDAEPVAFVPIETDPIDPTREYIPLPAQWEIQTKGKGSSYRLLDRKSGERMTIMLGDSHRERDFVTRMAKEIHAAVRTAAEAQSDAEPVGTVTFWYRNYRGEISRRGASILGLRWGSSEYHKEPQWLLRAIDIEKNAEREFAIKDMAPTEAALAQSDAELSHIELNNIPEHQVLVTIKSGEIVRAQTVLSLDNARGLYANLGFAIDDIQNANAAALAQSDAEQSLSDQMYGFHGAGFDSTTPQLQSDAHADFLGQMRATEFLGADISAGLIEAAEWHEARAEEFRIEGEQSGEPSPRPQVVTHLASAYEFRKRATDKSGK